MLVSTYEWYLLLELWHTFTRYLNYWHIGVCVMVNFSIMNLENRILLGSLIGIVCFIYSILILTSEIITWRHCFVVNATLQSSGLCSHLNGFSPVCILMWILRLENWENFLLHREQVCCTIFLWTSFVCLFRAYFEEKIRQQRPQWSSSLFLWIDSMWALRALLSL